MSTPDTRTSDVDTTLRENEEELKLLMGAAALDFADLSEKEWEAILAYITKAYKLGRSEFHQLLNEKREAIEGMRKNIDYTDTRVTALDRNKYYRLKGYEQGRNKTIDDVLSILKD